MTNIKYLKENNLYNAHKQFMRMAEGYLRQENIEEAGEDEDPNAGADPNAGMDPNGGADPNTMGGDPNAGADPNAMGGDTNAGADSNAGMDPNAGMAGDDGSDAGADPNAGMDPNAMTGDMGADPSAMDGEMPAPEDDEEVIDVDDLTDAQEKLNDKENAVGRHVEKVDDKLKQLGQVLDKIEQMIDNNNSEIEALKGEFKKRNPTQTEKLNLRSLDSYPFNVKPTDYWKQKGMDSNYEAYSDNQEPTTQEYKITNDDVDNINDNEIANSFFIDDDLKQDINKIFGVS